MKRTIKIFAFIMALIMLVGTFASCSKKNNGTDETKESVEVNNVDTMLNHAGDIPDGGAYHPTKGEVVGSTNGTVSQFPELAVGDKYYYGDYVYVYSDGSVTDGIKGWGVEAFLKDKNEYGVILETINGAPVISLNTCFKDCVNMKYSPKIPDTVYSMVATYKGCSSLVQTPIFPTELVNMKSCFEECMELTMASELPEKLEIMSKAFYSCTNLISVPVIPASVKQMDYAFANCFNIEGEITVNANPEVYEKCFDSTMRELTIVGDTAIKAELAATSFVDNIKY
ncbi:MAG: leucine-rich repeat protein [Clostridia bacterium]|nr:leucine-rich repeat protein [Clostridia bacterium]